MVAWLAATSCGFVAATVRSFTGTGSVIAWPVNKSCGGVAAAMLSVGLVQ